MIMMMMVMMSVMVMISYALQRTDVLSRVSVCVVLEFLFIDLNMKQFCHNLGFFCVSLVCLRGNIK